MQKVYADVFEQIITEMEQGRTPWVRPWTGGGPYNAATGRRYSGGNVIALIFAGAQYSTQGWLTWNQAIEAGCVVRKGERSTTVFFMSKAVKKATQGNGPSEADNDPASYFFARGFRVFNLDQLDELEPGALASLKARHTPETLNGFEAFEDGDRAGVIRPRNLLLSHQNPLLDQ